MIFGSLVYYDFFFPVKSDQEHWVYDRLATQHKLFCGECERKSMVNSFLRNGPNFNRKWANWVRPGQAKNFLRIRRRGLCKVHAGFDVNE